MRFPVNLEEIKLYNLQLKEIARKYGINKVFIFGSVARGESSKQSDIDFLVEMQDGASMLGVGGFSYEVEQLLGIFVDVIPTSVLSELSDRDFAERIQVEAVAI